MEPGTARERLAYHGGDLGAAQKLFPDAPNPWIDLSTGINPRAYPVPPIDPDAWHRLPGPDMIRALEGDAALAYGLKDSGAVVAAPGTQALLQWLPHLLPARRVGILGFTYGEHGRLWAASGAEVACVEDLQALAGFDVAVVVNPNNPDGRRVTAGRLSDLAAALARRGGLLVVDEAFMDTLGTAHSLVSVLPPERTIVLRSFGKMFGLAGLRLGFAVATPDEASRIRQAMGPWAVSGPAIMVGRAALRDTAWQAEVLAWLRSSSDRLDDLLERAGFTLVGGTPLFRLASSPLAPNLFERLARAGILVRPFAHRADWLRFGLPADERAWDRLGRALAG